MTLYSAGPDLLNGRIIMVTGAGDGIGAAVAESFAAHGAQMILLGRTQKKLEGIRDNIVRAGNKKPLVFPLEFSTATDKHFLSVAEQIGHNYDRLDGLLHNAAVLGTLTPIEHFNVQLWSHVFQVNVHVPFMLTQMCLPLLKKSKEASIVFTSSNVGYKGQAYWGAYAASKAASDNLAEVLAEELEVNTTIRVNTIDPGTVRTRMHEIAYPGNNPTSLPESGDITAVYLYLMGHDSAGITGERFHAQQQ